jgi:hypothetical protein
VLPLYRFIELDAQRTNVTWYTNQPISCVIASLMSQLHLHRIAHL